MNRRPLHHYGKQVSSMDEACNAIGFTVESEQAARLSTGKAIPGTQNLYHSQTGFLLGQHKEGYSFLQPCESLRTLEKAREIVGGDWSSVSSIKGGRQIAGFVTLRQQITAPKRGDKTSLSLAYFDRYDGGGKTRFQLFANVLVCTNGATRAENVFSFSEKHTGSLRERFAAMEFKLLFNVQTQVEEFQAVVSKLDTTEMRLPEMENFARQLFPATDETDVPTRTQNMRDAIVAGFSRGTGNRGVSRWDAFNAVTEFLDWQSTFRETEFSREENRFESLVSGSASRTRSRAMELLLN